MVLYQLFTIILDEYQYDTRITKQVQKISLISLDIFKKMSIIIIRTYVPNAPCDLPKKVTLLCAEHRNFIRKERKSLSDFPRLFFCWIQKGSALSVGQ
nr:MAG TPA: hypothetical protein [Caudoviricetes sp.]